MVAINRIPTTVITGFLGAGKTTIILHLVEHLQAQGQKVIYIKNEIGEEDLDTKLVRGQNIVSRELLNGCICCTLVGPFISAINEIIESYQPDRIIIESAGTADPAALALMVANHPRLLRDGVISIIDVVNFEGYKDISEVARRQAKLTDLIVFNKVELVDDDRKRTVVGYVRELNEYSPIVEAPQGKLDPRVAFGIDSQWSSAELTTKAQHAHDHETHDDIQAVTMTLNQPIAKDRLDEILASLPKNIFRVKGFVNLEGMGWRVLNGVFKRFEYFEFAKPELVTESKLIFIGYHIEKTELEHLFSKQF
ncbi:MAG TPA: GTP-binding protein [Patescibacteria group bacterium]